MKTIDEKKKKSINKVNEKQGGDGKVILKYWGPNNCVVHVG